MEVLIRERFLSNDQEHFTVPQGLTVDEILASVNWSPDLHPWTYVTVDGVEVPEDYWRSVKPKEGHNIRVALRPAGGGGGKSSTGKQIGMIVAAVAISVVAAYAAPFVVGAMMGSAGASAVAAAGAGATIATVYPVTTALVTAGIAIAGNLALAALVQPGKLGPQLLGNSGSGGNSASESSTYSIKGATNNMNPYGVVPRVYGRNRMTPPLAAEPYVVSSGTAQTLHLLLDFGYGPLLVEDIRIGNTPIGEFTTARWFIHSHYTSGQPLNIYLNDQATLDVSAVLVQGQDNVRAVPQAGSVINLEFSFPAGLIEFNDQGASSQRNEHITIFAAPAADPNNWQPISDFSPYSLFSGEGGTDTTGQVQISAFGVMYWNRDGAGDGFITGDPAAQSLPTGALFSFMGQNYTIQGVAPMTNPNYAGQWVVKLDRFPPEIYWVYGMQGVLSGHEGEQGTVTTYAGGVVLGPLTVTFGPASYDVEFHGQTRSPRTVTVILQMPYEDVWRILVRRSTPVSNSSLVSNAIMWSSVRSGRWSGPIYPKSMRTIMEIAVTATEQVSGQVQGINALVTSILWDGRVGAMVASRNPGVIYQDILTGAANPRAVGWDRIDQSRCQTWATNCDALSAQGDTSNTFDLVVDFRSTVAELCQTVCTAGRAAPTMRDGLYSILEEEATRTPVQMFTNRNASGWSSTRTWVDYPHAIRAKYMSENTWNQEEMFVYRDGYDSSNSSKFESMEFPGLTRPWQVWRAARYFIAAAMLRRERLSITADVENLVCQRGDLVKIAHDRLFSNIVVRAREIEGQLVTHDGLIEWGALTPPLNYQTVANTLPANTGAATAIPTGWATSGTAAAGVTVTWGNKGVSPDGRPYVDMRLFSSSLIAGAVSLNMTTAAAGDLDPTHDLNTDDMLLVTLRAALVSAVNLPAGFRFTLAQSPQTIYGSGGFGILDFGDFNPTNVPIDSALHTKTLRVLTNNGQLGIVGRSIPQIRFNITTGGSPLDITLRIVGVELKVSSKKVSTLDRLTSASINLNANSSATGAKLGVLTGTGTNVLPTGWTSVTNTGWTRTVTATRRVWNYYDVDIRFQAAIGAAACTIEFLTNAALPATKILSHSVNLRTVSSSGTIPTFKQRQVTLTSAGAFIQNNDDANFAVSTTMETRDQFNNVNVSAVANAARFTHAFVITPVAGQASDVTLRFRLPTSSEGTTDAISRLTAQADPPSWYADIRSENGAFWNNTPIFSAPAPDQIVLSDSAVYPNVRPGDLIAIGQLNTETGEWLVDKVTPGPDFTAAIELMEEAPGVYSADSGPIPPYVPNNGNGILSELGGVRSLRLNSTLYIYTEDGFPTHELLLTWDPPTYDIREYVIYRTYVVTNPGSSPAVPFQNENVRLEIGRSITPMLRDTVDARTLRLNGTTLLYEVIPISRTGRRGTSVSVSGVFYPDVTGPPAVKFTTNVLSETTMLIWDRPVVPDLGGYQIRFLSGEFASNPLWENMISVVDNVSPVLTSLTVHSQTGVYAIRAYDTSGNFGPMSYSVTKIDKLPNVNEITRLVEGPTFTGTFVNTEVVANELRLKKDTFGNYFTEGWFYATSAVDYPASWIFRVRGAIDAYALPSTPDPKGDWNVQIWVSIQKFAPKLDSAWFVPLSHAAPLAGGPDTYVPLGTVANTDLQGRLINWAVRLISRRADLTPSIKQAILIVDHSERREFGNDIPIGTGGKLITFRYPFFAIPSIAVTINDGATGDRLVKSATATALTVEVFTSAGVSVNRKIDWQALGYGRGVS